MKSAFPTVITEKLIIERNLLVVTSVFLILVTNVTVLLNVPVLRTVFGFAFLTILPGALLFQFFKLRELGFLEKGILWWGLSIGFVMFYTLAVNFLLPTLGYGAPLTTSTLLFSFDAALVVLTILSYPGGSARVLPFPRVDLANADARLYMLPLFFPLLSVIGTSVMNTTANNAILIALFFIIALYVVFMCFRKGRCPRGLYTLSILSISLSLLFLLNLRSPHLVGADVHLEFYQFTSILNDHQLIFGSQQSLSTLYGGVANIVLPVAYQLVLGMDPEALYKVIYSALFAVVPLIVYVIARRHVEVRYAFIASFVYMAQFGFLWTNAYSRATTAVLFFSLACMVLFSYYKSTTSGLVLFIVFGAAGIVSHYSTAYLFILMVMISVILIALLPKRGSLLTRLNVSTLVIFASVAVLWYSLITNSSALANGFKSLSKSLVGLIFDFFSPSALGPSSEVLGQGVVTKSILEQIQFAVLWAIFACIALGVLTLIVKRKEMMTLYSGFAKPSFLRARFETEHFAFAIAASVVLILTLFVPFWSATYSLDRTYFFVMTILSVFFVIGVITLSRWAVIFLATIDARVRKKTASGRKATNSREAPPRTPQYVPILVALVVIVPYFLCVTGALYAATGVSTNMILSSTGDQYFILHITDQDSQAAKWIHMFGGTNATVAASDTYGEVRLVSQAHIALGLIRVNPTANLTRTHSDFIYLYSLNVVENKYHASINGNEINLNDPALFTHSKVMDAGSAAVYVGG